LVLRWGYQGRQFNSAIYIYAQLTPVAMATKFGTKWAMTQHL